MDRTARARSLVPWKDGGVYLITGGAGGLGLLLAEEIRSRARRPAIWLTSRSPLTSDVSARLEGFGAIIVHRRVDVTRPEEVAALVAEMRAAHGHIDGIVHVAGLTRDKWLVRKSVEELREVLAPKVAGLANLDAATAGLPLDFLLLFSSVSGALGNPGQSDYAAANAFMDAFAAHRNRQVELGERQGRTLSVDWPYWRDGGMRMDQATQDALRDAFGAAPLETAPAMAALRAALSTGEGQVLVLDGDRERLRRGMMPRVEEPPLAIADSSPDPQLRSRVIAWAAAHLADVLKIPASRLDPQEPLDRYGIDSVLSVEVVDALSRDLGAPLPQTLLFEYPKLSLLADALLESHRDALCAQFGIAGTATEATPTVSPVVESESRDIAVIAVSGRYPGADTIEEFWELLQEGRDCVTEIPADRWDHDAIFSPEKGKPGASYCKWGGFLSGIDRFDAAFFGVTPRDAALMDPQDRLFLETVWRLVESAGYTREMLREGCHSQVGVFAGSMYQHYHAVEGSPEDEAIVALSSHASLANRVSFFFDLQGPSLAIDTMCSSGLQAVHLARQSLERGECRLAIAGAVNLSLHPSKYVGLSRAALLGSSAQSRAFAEGDGYLPAEGVGAVLLKPLADAMRDGDNILAVIKGSAANHGGHSAGYSTPSADAQARLLEENFRASGINPRTIGYVEAAANGSALGDAIEFRSLTRAFRAFTADSEFCAIGSVKTNMGHAEAASGMAQLTKVLLQIERRRLVPSLRGATVNRNIDFAGSPFVLQAHGAEWNRMRQDGRDVPLRATVSSFGAGGSNVHLILEEPPGQEPAIPVSEDPRPRRFVFSAHNEERLETWLRAMHDFIEQRPALSLSHLSYTLRARREAMACRFEVVARHRAELLDALLRKRSPERPAENGNGPSVFASDGIDWSRVPPLALPEYPFARERHWLAPAAPAPVRAPAPELSGRAKFLALIARTLREELGLPDQAIRPSASFRDHGADSMFSLRLIHALSEETGTPLSHSDLARYSTPESLAEFLSTRRAASNGHGRLAPPAFAPHDLSENQKGLWVQQKLYPGTSAYNVPLAFRVATVDRVALAEACRFVLEQFPILSTVIEDADPEPQIVARTFDNPLQVVEAPPGVDSIAFARQRARRAFDLDADPPIRFELLLFDEPIVLIVVHHIVFDGVSAMHFTNTFWSAYQCFARGAAPSPPPPAASYADFVEWERRHLQSPEGEADLAYWRRELAGDLPVLRLPADHAADPSRPFEGDSLDYSLTPELSRRVRECAARLGINASAFFLGVFQILLYRYTGQDDILIAVPTAGRPARRFERTIGYFANMIAMRVGVSGSAETAAFLKQLQDQFTGAMDHAAYPFAAMARQLTRDALTRPLHHVSYSYQNFLDEGAAGPAGVAHLPELRQEGDGALALEIFDSGPSVRIVAGFDSRQFDPSTIRRLLDHFVQLAQSVSERPESTIAALDLLCAAERDRILTRWNHTTAPARREGTVHEWIQQQAAHTPDAIAVIAGERRLSYRALLRRANRLAAHLRARGIAPGAPVGVCLGRGPESIVAMLAVWTCGAVWVPLDPAYPDRRLSLILADAGVAAIVTDATTEGRVAALRQGAASVIRLGDRRVISKRPTHASAVSVPGESPAYIIYTSGSTGLPKGVVVSHRAIAHHCLAAIEGYRLGCEDVVLQFASHSVDAALEQIVPALICGARLVLRGDELWSPENVRAAVDTHRLTIADLPPAYLRELLEAWADDPGRAPSHSPRLLIVGGEALTPATVRLWQASPWRNTRLLNAYGPTEATITATVHEVSGDPPGENIPIGRPLAFGEVYILDRDGNPVPEGVPGELHLGGLRLATGYHGAGRLTEECFVPNPFSKDPERARLYRTGDLACFVPGSDGVITFHGRLDHQVKLRGFRIELGEVESALRAFGFHDAVAVVRTGATGDQALIAYVAPERPDVPEQELVAFLAERLPPYMLPAAHIRMAALPLTSGGKLDRRSLPEIAASGPVAAVAPRDGIEERLACLWGQLLGRDSVGAFDDFFACGGHSLLCLRLLTLIRREFGRELTLASLLQAPTLAQQARLLRERTEDGAGSPLLLLAEGGSGEPLFCVHPVGGGVLCYAELARSLRAERPIYGLQSTALDGGPLPGSVPEMAAAYVAAIREIQPEGPYHLAGWSAGGVIAFEMAQQLRRVGQVTRPLVLIDSYTPAWLQAFEAAPVEPRERALRAFAADLLGVAPQAVHLPAETPPDQVVDEFLNAPPIDSVLRTLDPAQRRRLFDTFQAISRALSEYAPRPYDGPITRFAAAQGRPADASGGWELIARGGLTIHELAGDHYSVLKAPELSEWARVVADCLRSPASRDPEPAQVVTTMSGDR